METINQNRLTFELSPDEHTATVILTNYVNDFTLSKSIIHNNQEYIINAIKRNKEPYYNRNCSSRSILFSEDVLITLIDENAFSNFDSLTKIKIPKYVKKIGKGAFKYCSKLREIIFSDKSELQITESLAFSNTDIQQITIPSHIKQLPEDIFKGCSKLEQIEFTNDSEFQHLENSVFNLKNLKKIIFPPSLKKINNGSLKDAIELKTIEFLEGNKNFVFVDNMLEYKENEEKEVYETIIWACHDIENIVIPSYIKEISDFAFYNCSNLKNIEFDQNSELVYIGNEAFRSSGITQIIFPKNTLYIGTFAFLGDESLQSVELPENFEFQIIINQSFRFTSIQKIKIPSSIKKIDHYAFSCCKNLKSVDFCENSNLQIIGHGAFRSSGIESITIPSTVKEIGNFAFSECKNLETVNFQNNSNLRTIGGFVFKDSTIAKFIIPSKVDNISDITFKNACQLNQLEVSEENKHYIYENNSLMYKSKEENKVYDTLIFVNQNVESFVLPTYIKIIETKAFLGCSKLSSFEIEKGSELECIDNNVFDELNLTTIVIPWYLSNIPLYFKNYDKISHVAITDDEVKINKNSFYKLQNLVCVSFPYARVIQIDEGSRNISYLHKLKIDQFLCNEPLIKARAVKDELIEINKFPSKEDELELYHKIELNK